MILLGVLLGLAVEGSSPPALSWETDWRTAFKRARSEERLVFVDLWASWCGPCQEMDRKVFPDPEVVRQLQRLVPLRIDVDLRPRYSTGVVPTYKIFDPWENERFRFSGYQDAETLTSKLTLIGAAAPKLIQGVRSLEERKSAGGHLLLAEAYLEAHAASYAREEFQRAAKLAKREGRLALAQVLEIKAAVALAMTGEAPKAAQLLEKILSKPVDAASATTGWMGLGRVRQLQGDPPGSAAAYRRALAVCPPESPLRQAVEQALAELNVVPSR